MIKLTKEKEVIKEEIEIEDSVYFFSSDDGSCFWKIDFYVEDDCFIFYKIVKVENYSDKKSISLTDNSCDVFPWYVEQLFLNRAKKDNTQKEITEQEFEQQKQEVIKRLL